MTLMVLLFLCWIPEVALPQTPGVAVLISVLMATALIFLMSYSQFRMDRRYKQVTATTKDYFISNSHLYLIGVLPGLALVGFLYFLPLFGILTLVYADVLVLGIVLFLARFPLALRLGQRAVPVTDSALLSSFSSLASRMGVPHTGLYSIDWRRFKAANAFQSGPRKFSVYVSNYLLENMTTEEVSAVMAHELAHAKRRHVLKVTALLLCTSMVGLDIFVAGAALDQTTTSFWTLVSTVVGLAVIVVGSQLILRLRRRFELEADEIAVRTLEDGRQMASALRRLMELNLLPVGGRSGTHPSIGKRIERIEQLTANQQRGPEMATT